MVFSGYRVTSNYGWRIHPISKINKFHAGIDLVKTHKAPIYAFTGGTVQYSGIGVSGSGVGGYGNVVVIKDSNGYIHVYAHLDSVNVKKGQNISKGDMIGRQGATGQVTGSHLHYEIRKPSNVSLGWTSKQETSTVDPTKYLNGADNRMLEILIIDGKRGTKTIKRWQQFLGTPVDGVISKTSQAIKKWQIFLNTYGGVNLKVDGIEDKKTIYATQKFFGTKQDGYISDVSLVIKELQKFLNNFGR